MILIALAAAVEAVRDRLEGRGIPWAVSGSVALALQGVAVSCCDLDVVTTAAAAEHVTRLLAGTPLEPVAFTRRGDIRGLIGRTELDGVDVDVLGDVQNLLPDGRWTAAPRLDACVVQVTVGGRSCPVVELSHLREAYAAMGKWEAVRLIEVALADGD